MGVSAEEPPIQDPVTGVTRVRCKARKDGAEGWVTLKGNAGTIYAESSSKHYFVVQEVPLHAQFTGTAKNCVLFLAEGETLEALEGPKEQSLPPQNRIKVRLLSSSEEGWVDLADDVVEPRRVRSS